MFDSCFYVDEDMDVSNPMDDPADTNVTDGKDEINEEGEDVYYATRMSAEELEQIDELWKDTENKMIDVEPYRANRNMELDEWEKQEPYKAVRSSDIEKEACDTGEGDDSSDKKGLSDFEKEFAADIAAMDYEDLKWKLDHQDELTNPGKMEILEEYDAMQKENDDSELFHSLIDGMPKEALEYFKDGLENGNQKVYDYFGIRDNEDDEDREELKLSRKR